LPNLLKRFEFMMKHILRPEDNSSILLD